VVIETGGDERAPIILGRPFLNTAKAIIYTDNAKICFNIKGEKKYSHSRSVHSKLLHIPKHRTTTKTMMELRRKRTIRGTSTSNQRLRQ
jgi:hypothetical protein